MGPSNVLTCSFMFNKWSCVCFAFPIRNSVVTEENAKINGLAPEYFIVAIFIQVHILSMWTNFV